MEEFIVYRNMKRWLLTFGDCLLDYLVPITNPYTSNPLKRYEGIASEIDNHFNLLAFYRSQVEPSFPLILVSIEDISDNSCFKTYQITFDVYFQTISPHDCKDDFVSVINSPEAMLEYMYNVNCGLSEMMYRMDSDLRGYDFDGTTWQYPINYNVITDVNGSLEGIPSDEILHFTRTFTILDNKSCC